MNLYNKIQLFRYYMNENNNHSISIVGIISDILFVNIFLWIFVYLWTVYKTKSPLISALLSVIFIALLDIAIYIKLRKAYNINRKKRRRETVVNHLSYRISQLNSEEFQLQLIRLLLNCKGFSNIYKEDGLLKADYNNTPVAIGFHHPPPGGKTPFSKVWEFVHQSKSLGLEQGFFFTSSSFEEDCDIQRIKNLGFTLHLMDVGYIMDRMEKGGMFPDENTIDQLIIGEIRKEKIKKHKVKEQIFSPIKARQYLFLSILFLIVSLLISDSRFYYLAVSLLFATLALLIKLLAPESYNAPEEESTPLIDDNPHNLT